MYSTVLLKAVDFYRVIRYNAIMSKFEKLWQYVTDNGESEYIFTFDEIQKICGVPIDHSFLNAKKELLSLGYSVKKISLKAKSIFIVKID